MIAMQHRLLYQKHWQRKFKTMITVDDIKQEIKQTLDELKEATISSHKDYCMRKLDALYTLEQLKERN